MDDIKKGCKEFFDFLAHKNIDGCEIAKEFVLKVLGYNPDSDLLVYDVEKHKDSRTAINPDKIIKFYLECVDSGKKIDDKCIHSAYERALFAGVNVFVVTNWDSLFIFDRDDDATEPELMYEVELSENISDNDAVRLWMLGNKDCNKAILLNQDIHSHTSC